MNHEFTEDMTMILMTVYVVYCVLLKLNNKSVARTVASSRPSETVRGNRGSGGSASWSSVKLQGSIFDSEINLIKSLVRFKIKSPRTFNVTLTVPLRLSGLSRPSASISEL